MATFTALVLPSAALFASQVRYSKAADRRDQSQRAL